MIAAAEHPILIHISELRKRLFWSAAVGLLGFALCLFWFDPILAILSRPLADIQQAGPYRLYMSNLVEGFSTRIKVSAIVGILATSPFHVFNILGFILPALKQREKMWLLAGCMASFLLVVFSVYLTYFKIMPMSFGFLTDASMVPPQVGVLFDYHDNIMLILKLLGYSLLLFQTPILLEVLLAMNIIKRRTLWRNSRFVVVFIFILAAFVTPPDFVSQLAIGVPLTVLYFATLLVAKIFKFGESQV